MRNHIVSALLFLLLGTGLILFQGCATLYQETASRVLQDRSGKNQVLDAEIHTGILRRIADKNEKLLLDISADVWERRVMLTGTLDDPKTHAEVIQLAKSDDRILEFFDHIQLVSPEQKETRRQQREAHDQRQREEKGGAVQTANDFWIETKIKAKLLTTRDISSVNYFCRSVFNRVYVIGKARSRAEKERVMKVIGESKGVQSITEHIALAQ